MIAAGLVAGTLPLVHAHSFMVVMVVAACLALLQRRWRDWFVFFCFASLLALPQIWWSTHNSAVDAKTFFEWHFGWDRGKENAVWFWLKNTGIFIPLIAVGDPLARKKLSDSSATADLLLTLHALFHHSQFDQTRTVGVGQYQSALLLVAGISAARSAPTGAPMAAKRNQTPGSARTFRIGDSGR